MLLHGDQTEIGETEVALSQRQKVHATLTRAVYHGGHTFSVDDGSSAIAMPSIGLKDLLSENSWRAPMKYDKHFS